MDIDVGVFALLDAFHVGPGAWPVVHLRDDGSARVVAGSLADFIRYQWLGDRPPFGDQRCASWLAEVWDTLS